LRKRKGRGEKGRGRRKKAFFNPGSAHRFTRNRGREGGRKKKKKRKEGAPARNLFIVVRTN